jgi:hypothetical protein
MAMLTSNKMSIGMENNILKDLGLLLPLLTFCFLFDTMESLARFVGGGRVFLLFCVPFFRVAEKDCEHNLSHLCGREKRHILRSQSLSLSSPVSEDDFS